MKVFNAFDTNKNGFIEENELSQMLFELGILSAREIMGNS